MRGRVLASYGEQLSKGIVKLCEGSADQCKDYNIELGRLYHIRVVYEADPKKLDPSSIEDLVMAGVSEIKKKYPNINITYLLVVDPRGDGEVIEIVAEVFDPNPEASLAPPVIAIVELILILSAILFAAGILVGAIRFFIFMATASGKVILEKFIDTIDAIIVKSGGSVKEPREAGQEGGGEEGAHAKRALEALLIAGIAVVAGIILIRSRRKK